MHNKRQNLLISLLLLTVFVTPISAFAQEDDSSDEDFAVPVSVDLQINGQNNALTVPKNTRIAISWESEGAVSCKVSWTATPQKTVGRITGKISASRTFTVTCRGEDGAEDSDSIRVTVGKQGSPAPTTTSTSSLCNPFSRNVSVETDLRSDEIVALGKVLFKVGLYPTVTFDKQDFATGVADFQTKYGISKTGTIDSATRAKLNSLYECPKQPEQNIAPVQPTPPLPPSTPPVTVPVQPSLITPTATTPAPPPAPASSKPLVCGQKGDVDGDGQITSADRERVRAFTSGATLTDEERVASDVNGSGDITLLDGTLIYNYLTGSVQTFAGCVFVSKPMIQGCSLRGDLDGKETIDNEDITILREGITGLRTLGYQQRTRGDVDGDGQNTTLDIQLIRRYLLGLSTTFPVCSQTTTQPSLITPTATAPVPPPAPASSKPLVCGSLGDVNDDGVLSSADSDKVKQFTSGAATPTDIEQTRADVNASGNISTLDSSIIIGYLAGTSSSLPGCSTSATPPVPTTISVPTVDLKIDGSSGPISIASGSYITPSWTSTNASYCVTWGGNRDSTSSPGTTIGPITESKTYTITCYNSAGTSVASSVEVSVQAPASTPPPPVSTTPPPTPDSLTFTALSSSDDKSSGSTFAPGSGPDWNYTATLSLGSAKTIKSMRIVAGGEIWTTMPEGSYWNIVIFDAGAQINNVPVDNLNLTAGPGSKSFTLYTQKWNQTFNPSYTLTVTFTDGTTLTAPVSGSPVSFRRLFEQFANALTSLYGKP